ncbi:hypothetical protein [Shimia sp. SDUM112013]|uniref:hypothetical protein n=1 Tax=Shimia sp. SDUM112013 TaxID=3136160 RepID=UPI0032EE3FD8
MATGLGGAVFFGPEGTAQLGRMVRAIGDVNNDGIADFGVSTLGAGNGYGNPADNADQVGITYVVYGREGDYAASYDFSFGTGLQPDGNLYSVFQGDQANGWLGEALGPAGDINGDGIDDLIVGSDRYNSSDGGAFVIYGQDGGLAPILEPSDLNGTNGASITVASGSTVQFGIVLDGLGDVNGDGFDDLYLSSQNDNQTYLLFGNGNPLPATVDLTTDLPGRVHVFTETSTRGEGIGDINGDGLGDFMIRNRSGDGSTVIFGDASLTGGTTDLSTAVFDGTNGFVANFGGLWRANEAGDVNGDGVGDFVVLGHSNGYLIFGSTTGFPATLDPATLNGVNGVTMSGGVGFNIGGTGDVNGDGIDDFLLANRNVDTGRGATYVVFGQSTPFDASLDLTTLDGTNGYRLPGTADFDNMGGGAIADVNNDGFADIVTAAQRFDMPSGGSIPIWDVGAAFVVYGGAGRLAALDAEDGAQDGEIDLTLIGETLTFDDSNGAIVGTAGNDTLTGTEGDDTLKGLDGDDVLFGLAGNDDIQGGAGNDTISGTAGADRIDGGDGRDMVFLDLTGTAANAYSMAVDLARGAHIIEFHSDTDSDVLLNIEDYLLIGDISMTLAGSDVDNTLTTGSGDDNLRGRGGDDLLSGGDGSDILAGEEGNDTLIGGNTENDLRDVVYGGNGNDSIDGGYGNDELRGDAGNDTIEGGFGADTVIGGAGADILSGSAWSDVIFGGDGDDFVNGGWGHDRVNGGAGADRFFHIGIRDHGSDWIQDYDAAEGDVLVFGIGSATRDQFQINTTHTSSPDGERSGDDSTEEAFIIYRPTGQIMWALVDGAGQDSINLMIAGQVYDLMA